MEFLHYGKQGLILKLIPEAMKKIGNVAKNRQRKVSSKGDSSFAFRGIDDALNACGPVFAELGITPSVQLVKAPNHETLNGIDSYSGKQITINRSDVSLCVTLIAEDGSWVRSSAGGMATDKNDNTASNKAHSAAVKYCIFMGLMIPVERLAMDDSDSEDDGVHTSNVERASSGLKSSERPGDDKSEEFTQAAMVALQDAYSAKDKGKIAELMNAALRNTKFSESQRAAVVKTGKDFLGQLNKPATAPRTAGQQPPTQQGTQTGTGQQRTAPPAGQQRPAGANKPPQQAPRKEVK
jgi:hypothetical protein